jgi:preprotein translocase subunit SecF
MYNIIGKKYLFLIFSTIIIIPGIVSLILFGLNLSIEFTGGSRLTFVFEENVSTKQVSKIQNVLKENEVKVSTVERSTNQVFVRTEPLSQENFLELEEKLKAQIPDVNVAGFETIGPTIGREITLNAIKAIAIASILIVLYISYSFRKVPKPASSIRFGIVTIVSLVHDVLVLVGIFSILGHFLGVEIDSLFVTAILTVIGFSVHDTIVVFDRIRENLKRQGGDNFAQTVNDSILQTFDRSLNTSLTTILVLTSLLIFGGESIRWFVVALLIGVISGTYSSIFNAAPLLVIWQELVNKRLKR